MCLWCSSPIHAVVFENMICHFHSFEVLVKFRLHNHDYFYRGSISRKTATHSWRVLSTHETYYSSLDANLIFYGLGGIIIFIIIIIFVVLLLLLFCWSTQSYFLFYCPLNQELNWYHLINFYSNNDFEKAITLLL